MPLFASDRDYPTLWQHIARLRLDCQRYGATGKRHLRLALLHLAVGNYERAARDSRLSQQRSHDLPEATHALALALLGQALASLGLVEMGPASRLPKSNPVQLAARAARALEDYVASRPDDEDAGALLLLLRRAEENPGSLADTLAGLARTDLPHEVRPDQ